MRLTCPSCKAQYEVDAAVIPAEGRDVQCSNCGTTWFQPPEGAPEAPPERAAPEPAAPESVPPESVGPERAAPERAAAPPSRPESPAGGAAAAAEGDDDDDAAAGIPVAGVAPTAGTRQRRALDEAVASVLREEAERETRARRAEGSALDSQSELGLADAYPAAPATPLPPALPAGDAADDLDRDAGPAGPEVTPRQSRSELLPDIEEINSTLRSSAERGGDPAARDVPETPRQRRSGFRRGFLAALFVMILALLPYIFAQEISTRAPALGPVIAAYSHAIDGMRLWLDGLMRATTDAIRGEDQAGASAAG